MAMTSPLERGRIILLPPCRVCGGQASGLHFGVNTCEACKAFFRRCLKRKETHTCARDQKCEINTETKSFCAYCRYQKCLKVGMSIDAVKTGRYTLERKAELMREMGHTANLAPMEGLTGPDTMSTDGWDDTDVKRRKRDTETESMIRLICSVTEAFRALRPYTSEILREIPHRHRQFPEEQQLLEDIFGPMKPLPPQEYMEIYQGTDMNGRRDRWREALPRIEQSLLNMVKYARSLPSFTSINMPDQAQLLRRSGFMWWVINSYAAVNVEQNCYTSCLGQTVKRDEMKVCDFQSADRVEKFFEVSRLLQNIGPDDETQALMMAICLTSSDECHLMDPGGVSQLQNQFIEALDLHLRSSRERHLQVLGRIMVVISQIHKVDKLKGNHIYQQIGLTPGPFIGEFYYSNCEREKYQPPRVPVCGAGPPLQMTSQMTGAMTNFVPSVNQPCSMMPPVSQMQPPQPYGYPMPCPETEDLRYICL